MRLFESAQLAASQAKGFIGDLALGMTDVILLWFRQDLRLDDHPALQAALKRGGLIVPVFIWAPHEEGDWPPGAASRWWLHHSLEALDQSLRKRGSRLILRRCHADDRRRQTSSLEVLKQLIRETRAQTVYWCQRYEPAVMARDQRIAATLLQEGVEVCTFNSALLYDPGVILTADDKPYQVFTPFWRACQAAPSPDLPIPNPRHIPVPAEWPASDPLADLKLEPDVDWTGGLRAAWHPGEGGAMKSWQHFLANSVRNYSTDRDWLAPTSTSQLSPHLHWGEISPRRLWHDLRQAQHKTSWDVGSSAYVRQLGWREFAYHLLVHFPHTPLEPLRNTFTHFPWRSNDSDLKAWQRGRTGYPTIDAAMRQLWTTGWMHNRARMIVGSFLVKHLLISWQQGANWFWDTLVDADLANNTLGWQWVAGCGADAAPYFRVFNPVLQGRKFDPQGQYVKQWIPELTKLHAAQIHEPWEASAQTLEAAGVELGRNYPQPIVNHVMGRGRALKALEQNKRHRSSG